MQKAIIEFDLPSSCRECKIAFMHEVEESRIVTDAAI